jgi:outer membrane protein assembly factor BamE
MNLSRPILIGAGALLLLGCAPRLPTGEDIPFVHKIDIQQGNQITQEMVAQLHPGMEKHKVRFVMGTPIIADTFHNERWDYVYTFHKGGGDTEMRRVTIFFEDGKLYRIEGDVKPALGRLVVDTRQDTTVAVPFDEHESFFANLKVPFTGNDEDEAQADEETGEQEDLEVAAVDRLPQDETDRADELLADVEKSQNEIVIPEDAPVEKEKTGFFQRIFNTIGLGDEEAAKESQRETKRGERAPIDPTHTDQRGPSYEDPTSPGSD